MRPDIALLLLLLIHAVATTSNALVCLSTGGKRLTCGTSSSVCAAFTYGGTTFQGCMEKYAESGASNCLAVTALDPNACCCVFDECNTKEGCGIASNEDEEEAPSFPPTFNSRDEDKYCVVPDFTNSLPCDFGTSPGGWTYQNSSHIIPNIKGCVKVSDFAPFDNNGRLGPSDLWCPTALNINNVYQDNMPDWGRCECSPCRINPIAEPSGIATNGLCDFGPLDTWGYVAENGTIFLGLSRCVRVGDYPPIGYRDMGVSEDTLWCPDLNGATIYNIFNTEAAQRWGVCECAEDYLTPSPTPAPTEKSFVSTYDGRYCEIQSATPAPVQSGPCNFGTARHGEWSYENLGILDEGIFGCVSVGEFPPLFETPQQAGMSEETLWCPGLEGLDDNNVYDSSSSRSWGVCECATCRIISGQGQSGGKVNTGLCGFNRADSSWTYIGENGARVPATNCLTVGEHPPYNASSSLPPETLWCPGPNGVDSTFTYDMADEAKQGNWGLCECLPPPEEYEYEDTEVPSFAPTPSVTKSPSLLPSRSPSTSSPTASPFSFDTVCSIVDVPEFSTAVKGSGCGFGNGEWTYNDPVSGLSGPMTGCVSIRQFRPLGSAGMDESLLWCPGGQGGLNDDSVYSPLESPDPLNWGVCQCNNCEVVPFSGEGDDPFVGFVESGPCYFGENRTWFYEPYNSTGVLQPISGCASIDEYPPFPFFLISEIANRFPPGTRWCPIVTGLTPEGVYSFANSNANVMDWGLCDCHETLPPTPPTVPPTSAPTVEGETRSPTQSPTPRPTTLAPSRSPSTPRPTVPESCCRLVSGGPISSGECDFGPQGEWEYVGSGGSVVSGLTGCVSIDTYKPANSAGFYDQEKLWCATKEPQGLVDGTTYFNDYPPTRSNWGLCECPCYPTKAPTSKAPTRPPTPLDRLAVFIQTDHSGSIRTANPRCRSLTNGASTCWDLVVDFVDNLISNLTQQLGGPDKIRVFISSFSCVNKNPTSKVVTNGLTKAGDQKAIKNAIKTLRNLGAGRMQGTCPSKGASQIITQQRNLGVNWPSAYVIITDGRVQLSDEKPYKRNVRTMRNLMKERQGRHNICAATIGFSDKKEIDRLMNTECIFSATDFIEAASFPFSSSVASAMLLSTPAPTTTRIKDSGPWDEDGDDGSDGDGENRPTDKPFKSPMQSDTSIAVVVGTSFVIAGLLLIGGVFLLVKRRTRRRYIPKPHRPAEETFWVNNPAQKGAPSPPKDTPAGPGGQAPRRRSRASSDFAFFENLPPAPPLPESSEDEVEVILAAAGRPSSPSLLDRVLRQQQSEERPNSPSVQSPSLLDRARKTLSGFSQSPTPPPQMSPLSSSPTRSVRGTEALAVNVFRDDVEHHGIKAMAPPRGKFSRRLELEEDVHDTGLPAKRPHPLLHHSSSS